ncbi:MAG: hypothetical protein ABJA98_12560 [Acidobacteriota bacterium]
MLIAVVRTAGTVMGDFLSGEEGVDLGFAVGASLVGALLLAILLIPSAWKAAERGADTRRRVEHGSQRSRRVASFAGGDCGRPGLSALGMGVLEAVLTASVGQQPIPPKRLELRIDSCGVF